jgi:hypothetical protein
VVVERIEPNVAGRKPLGTLARLLYGLSSAVSTKVHRVSDGQMPRSPPVRNQAKVYGHRTSEEEGLGAIMYWGVFTAIVSTEHSPDGQQPGRGSQDMRRTVAVGNAAGDRGPDGSAAAGQLSLPLSHRYLCGWLSVHESAKPRATGRAAFEHAKGVRRTTWQELTL